MNHLSLLMIKLGYENQALNPSILSKANLNEFSPARIVRHNANES